MNKQELQVEGKTKKQNPMRKIKLEKIVLSCGATGPNLEKSQKLLEMLSGKKAQIYVDFTQTKETTDCTTEQ